MAVTPFHLLRGVVVLIVIACVYGGTWTDLPDPIFSMDFVSAQNMRDIYSNTKFDRYGSYPNSLAYGFAPTPKGNCNQLNNSVDGTNNYWRAGGSSASLPTGNNARTICAWGRSHLAWNFGANPAGQWQSFFHYGTTDSTNQYHFGIGINQHGNAFGSQYFTTTSMSGLPSYNNWQHVCLTYNGTWAVLYQNGTQVNQQNWGSINTYKDYLWVGYTYGQSAPHLVGQVSEVLGWNVALTPKQINDVFNYNATSCTPYFRNATNAGVRLDMTVPIPVDITTNTTMTRASGGPTCGVADTPIGKCGACNFNTSGSMNMLFPTSFIQAYQQRSVCLWAKTNIPIATSGVSNWRYMVFLGTGSTSTNHFIHSGYLLNSPLGASIGYNGIEATSTPWSINTWTHFCLVSDITNSYFYVNGTYSSYTASGNPSVTGNFYVGGHPSSAAVNNFNGTIANVIHFNTALSSTMVANLYGTMGCNSYFVECWRYGTNFVWTGDKCGCGIITPDNYRTTYYPTITSTSFTQNTLNVVIMAPPVATRVYTVTIEGATGASCSLGNINSYWNQTSQNCNETIALKLPWVNHTDCGFNLFNTDNDYFIYKGKILLSYTETLNTLAASNTTFTRMSSQSYEVYVSFQKNIKAKIGNFTIWSVAVLDFVYAGELYEAGNKTLSLYIDSILPWSSKLDNAVDLTAPAGVNLTSPIAVTAGSGKCDNTPNTQCIQRVAFNVKLTDANACTFNGLYRLNGTIWSCRNGTSTATAGCIPTRFGVVFTVASGSVCAVVNLNPLLTGELKAYYSPAFDVPYNTFSLTENVFFQVTINAGTGNIVYITFLDISFVDSREPGTTKFLLSNTTVTNDGKSTGLALTPDQKYFSLNLARSVFVIQLNKPAIFTFTTRVEVQFQGNRKRTFEAMWDVDNQKTLGTQISVADRQVHAKKPQHNKVAATNNNFEEAQDIDIATVAVIAAAAGVVALVIGIAGAAYYFKGRYTRYARLPATHKKPAN